MCQVESRTGRPALWEMARKGVSSVIPKVVGLPVWRPQSPPCPNPQDPDKIPLTAVLIICLSVALLLPRQNRDRGIYCSLEREEQKILKDNANMISFYSLDPSSSDMRNN